MSVLTLEDVKAVYKVDNWHSYASRDIIGIATCTEQAIEIIKAYIEKHNLPELCEQCIFDLDSYGQTQSFADEGEFHTESITLNTLI